MDKNVKSIQYSFYRRYNIHLVVDILGKYYIFFII